jgi:hypothetical protein
MHVLFHAQSGPLREENTNKTHIIELVHEGGHVLVTFLQQLVLGSIAVIGSVVGGAIEVRESFFNPLGLILGLGDALICSLGRLQQHNQGSVNNSTHMSNR